MSLLLSVGLILALHASPAQADLPSFVECESASSRVDLPLEAAMAPPKACISAGIATVLSFNADVDRDLVAIQGRERFESFVVADRMIVLKPKSDLTPGERFLLSVSFLDGAAPESATFLMIAHPALATRQIDVFRHARPVKAYQQEVQEVRAENAQLRSRVKQLEDQALTRGGLADLLANNFVDHDGIKTALLDNLHGTHGNALYVARCLSLYATAGNRAALKLTVSQSGSQEWSIKEVFLADDHGGVFKPVTWLGTGPIPPGNARYPVILEWHLTSSEIKRPFALVMVGDDGRTVRVSKVVFPQ
ncbi:DUF2381 family protein [Hyalangium sp.]|uniref:DUF2381 family protein n=1 Tax=Hyalangium sp. TaxID=2028555 RepID=UPI002D4C102D|nr:DUF2381 family protein [Hyalangium sp.]HYH97712.1 DUF2381 family protein [Hyalangium sp.]